MPQLPQATELSRAEEKSAIAIPRFRAPPNKHCCRSSAMGQAADGATTAGVYTQFYVENEVHQHMGLCGAILQLVPDDGSAA